MPRLLVTATLLLLAAAAQAQTAPSILIDPWPDQPTYAQTVDEVFLVKTGAVDQDGSKLSSWAWDSRGRIKFNPEDRDPRVVVGYRFLNLNVDAERTDLGGTFNDLAIAIAVQAGEHDGWRLGVIGGAGSANDDHWSESVALYGIGVIHLARDLAEGEQLHLGVSYDGNRTIWPDVPLPYLSYVNTTNPQLTWVLGLPISSVAWRPNDRLEMTLRYSAPLDLGAQAGYHLTDALSLFVEYERRVDAFHEHDATQDHDRLFYRRSLALAGVRYEHPWADVRLGVGWMFDQEFSRGWDVRDDATTADVSDELMLMVSVGGTF